MIRQLKNLCGIDVGCTNIKMISYNDDNIFIKKTIPSGDSLSKEELIGIISKFYNSCDYKINGIGIAFSGYTTNFIKVDRTSLPCLKELSISDFEHLNCKKIRLINDSNASALAGLLEYPESKVLLSITNGTGIGCGIVINGMLFTGSHGIAGEIHGNPIINQDGEMIKVGKICSGSKIFKNISQNYKDELNIIEQAAKYMAMEISSLIHSYNPDVIYLSGGGFEYTGYIKSIIDFIYKYTYSDFLTNLKIVRTKWGTYSGCFGAMQHVHQEI